MKQSYMDVTNWDSDAAKESTILTNPRLCEYIYSLVKDQQFGAVWDLGCNSGNLSIPFEGHKRIGVDRMACDYPYEFLHGDVLTLQLPIQPTDLVICNPPFNDTHKEFKRKLLPELFLRRIFGLGTPKVKTIIFVPMGFRLNQRLRSHRWRWLRDCGAKLSSILALPIDIFPNVAFHMEVLFFNFEGMEPHYFLSDSMWL